MKVKAKGNSILSREHQSAHRQLIKLSKHLPPVSLLHYLSFTTNKDSGSRY